MLYFPVTSPAESSRAKSKIRRRPGRHLRLMALLAASLAAAGCSSSRDQIDFTGQYVPAQWPTTTQTTLNQQTEATSLPAHWLASFNSADLTNFTQTVLDQNLTLAQLKRQVEIAHEQVKLARAVRLPSLSAALNSQRTRPQSTLVVSEAQTLSANISFELDLWGKLHQNQKAAVLSYAAAQAQYEDAQRNTAAQAVIAAFDAMTAEQLLNLFEARLASLAASLDIIQRGYRQGINEALDVYLAQTTYAQEQSRVASQSQVNFTSKTDLELLLSEFPTAQPQDWSSIHTSLLPDPDTLGSLPGIGAPSDLLMARPDIRQAWYELLSADASLAYAHRNRFPSLTLSASGSDSDEHLSDLLDGGRLGWSLAASLIQPLFQGGRLKSLEQQARLRMEQAEAAYLDVVFNAFAQVQNEINNIARLGEQLAASETALTNAEAALALANDQYQRGLVPYTTVLESQRRAFDTQTTVIQLKNQQLASRVRLYVALGATL